jgi:hypothetical protein
MYRKSLEKLLKELSILTFKMEKGIDIDEREVRSILQKIRKTKELFS